MINFLAQRYSVHALNVCNLERAIAIPLSLRAFITPRAKFCRILVKYFRPIFLSEKAYVFWSKSVYRAIQLRPAPKPFMYEFDIEIFGLR